VRRPPSRLVRRDAPAGRRLPGNDTAQVAVEREHVHRHQAVAPPLHDDVASVRTEIHLQWLHARLEAKRLAQMWMLLPEATADHDSARREV
jgi:hypothetical protein